MTHDVARIGMTRSVLILTPVRDRPTLEYHTSILRLLDQFRDLGIRVNIHHTTGGHIATARNTMVAEFLASDFDDALFIDDDVGFDAEMAWRLVVSPKQVIGGVHHKRTSQFPDSDVRAWAFGPKLAGGEAEPNAVEVAYVGTGFLKVAREAFELIIAKKPEIVRPGFKDLEGRESQKHYHRFFWFGPQDEGEDVMFCALWRSIGEKCWIDPGIVLSHIGSMNYTGSVTDCLRIVPAIKAAE